VTGRQPPSMPRAIGLGWTQRHVQTGPTTTGQSTNMQPSTFCNH